MVAGFVHGVLNSDNINVTGESFDYGPWRFNPNWDPRFTAAYFDHQGLYAFGRQAEAMHWNLAQLAISLRLISEAPPLVEALERFPALFQAAIVERFLWRLGVVSKGIETDRALVQAGERAMIDAAIPIADFFHYHRGGLQSERGYGGERYAAFAEILVQFEPVAPPPMPYWAENEPCSMLIDEVEAIWQAIATNDDWAPLSRKIDAVRRFGAALRNR
jgi:uncharacterized protein YdiU (UPF0061 family)